MIVLGAKVNGDRPSRMLADRLNAAAAYLDKHPQAACVVSGGQGSDEAYSEASVMQKYLVEKGIDPARIYLEDRSTNTHENLENSLQLIRQEGLCDTVVIATQVFHQYRAATLGSAGRMLPGWGLCPVVPRCIWCCTTGRGNVPRSAACGCCTIEQNTKPRCRAFTTFRQRGFSFRIFRFYPKTARKAKKSAGFEKKLDKSAVLMYYYKLL